ncbi:MAG: FIST C-terminal domain-containing protein [Synergistaceae bacterium]|jgi:hypothetical protein|nr:FIST C-terminal domain-containing protein [Synergistaceae bacterium]
MRNACTFEVDDPEAAVDEVLARLGEIPKNSVGILTCYTEYIDTGVVEELCKHLPFNVLGCTVLSSSTESEHGEEILSLAVLSGDDVEFSAVSTAPLEGADPVKMKDSIAQAYNQARKKLKGEPVFVFALLPILTEFGGGQILQALDSVAGGVPIYGGLSNDQTLTFEKSRVIWNGSSHKSIAALLLIRGNVSPKFYVTSIPEKNIQKQKAIITDAEGYLLKKVNGVPLLEYLASFGLATEQGVEALSSLPLLVDYGGGTKPVALGMYWMTPEGYAVCGGEMPVGATLAIGSIDYDGILSTAKTTLESVLQEKGGIRGILMFPCLTRSHMISPNSVDEVRQVMRMVGRASYLFSYSGGEICPVYGENGKIYNRFHNYTFTACVF